MAALLRRANLAVGRAGAGTLTELAITATPSVLIPYPFAAENHQAFNARTFVEAGAALMAEQTTLTAQKLEHLVLELLHDPRQLQRMATSADHLAVKDSAEKLADLIQKQLSLG